MEAIKKFSESFLITSAICAGIMIPLYYTHKWFLDIDMNNSVYYLNKRISQLDTEIINENNYDKKTKLIELKEKLLQRINDLKQKEEDKIRKIE